MTDILVDLLAEDTIDFNSSSIDYVGYDREAKRLYIEFQSSGTVYSYEGVEESTYNLLVGADSLNAFWRDHIKGNYTSGPQSEDVLVKREDEDPIQPDRKWLSVPEGETPDFAQGGLIVAEGEQDAVLLSNEGIFALGSLNIPVIAPSRFGVKWTSDNLGAGPFEPEFQALSEADALAQFNAQVTGIFGTDFHVKILAVTHYFD